MSKIQWLQNLNECACKHCLHLTINVCGFDVNNPPEECETCKDTNCQHNKNKTQKKRVGDDNLV